MELLQLYLEASYDRDSDYTHRAGIFADKLIKLIRNGNNSDAISMQDKFIIVFAGKIDSQYSDLSIIFCDKNYEKLKGSRGGFTLFRSKNEIDPVIVLPILDSTVDTLDYKNINRMVLVHEFIHYLDWHRYKNNQYSPAKNPSYKDNRFGYYNNPAEFNAYFEQASEYILNVYVDDPVLSQIFVRFGTFEKFKKWALEIFDPDFYNSLNSVYMRKFDKRLYQLYIGIMQKVKDIG